MNQWAIKRTATPEPPTIERKLTKSKNDRIAQALEQEADAVEKASLAVANPPTPPGFEIIGRVENPVDKAQLS